VISGEVGSHWHRAVSFPVICPTAATLLTGLKFDSNSSFLLVTVDVMPDKLALVIFLNIITLYSMFMCLQCFNAVGWAAGRASGL